MEELTVVGAGLAGCEAAFAAAERGIKVRLIEMKPRKKSPAHHSDDFAELVCSNSLKAKRVESAAGLLKREMQYFGSLTLESAYLCEVPAGGALAVQRDDFSSYITKRIKTHPNISVLCEEVTEIPEGNVIIATGPLTGDALAEKIKELCGEEFMRFYDAAAPIVTAESIDLSSAFAASRYDRGGDDDYLNCPMNREEYELFHSELVKAEGAPVHEFDKQPSVYEGCMPIEILARRGNDSIRFGPMKPVGLRDPRTGHRPWAVLQLRKENSEGTLYNLVGFQTNLKFSEQKRVFSLIPALKNAEFVRYGVMHRNTFINSPHLLNSDFSFRKREGLWFAGQITGVEGYMESAMSGILAGINAAAYIKGEKPLSLPRFTMCGALSAYISDESVANFQPMGANFGILPPADVRIRDKKQRYELLAMRALKYFEEEIQR